MDEESPESKRKAPQQYSKRQELNNHIVCMRNNVRKARVQIIARIVHQIKKYKNRKGKAVEQDKAKRKASRLIEEVGVLKKIKPDKVSLHALQTTETLEGVLNNPESSAEQRVLARLSHHPAIKPEVDKYRNANPNWDKQIPVLLAMTRERRGKKQELETGTTSSKSKAVQKPKSNPIVNESTSASESEEEDLKEDNSGSNKGDESESDEEVDSSSGESVDEPDEDVDVSKATKESINLPRKSLNGKPTIKELTVSSPDSYSKNPKTQSEKGKRLPLPVLNKSQGTVKVKVLTDLRELEEDVEKSSDSAGAKTLFVNLTQAPKSNRPKSSFFVGGVDEKESDDEGDPRLQNYNNTQKPSRQFHDQAQSKPVFRKGKLVSKPQPQRSNFKRGAGPSFKEDNFGGNFNPTIPKRSKFTNDSRDNFKDSNHTDHSQLRNKSVDSTASEKLHPSWEAKKKQQQISLTSFQGKKIVFDDDD